MLANLRAFCSHCEPRLLGTPLNERRVASQVQLETTSNQSDVLDDRRIVVIVVVCRVCGRRAEAERRVVCPLHVEPRG